MRKRLAIGGLSMIGLLASGLDAATCAELVEKADRSRGTAAAAGARLVAPATQPDEFRYGSGYAEAGGVPFYPDPRSVLLDRVPSNEDVLRRPWLTLARGETTVLIVAAYVVRPADAVALRARVLDWNGRPTDRPGVGVRPIVFAPVAQRDRKAYRMQGLWLAEPGPVQAIRGHVVAWAVRMEAGPHTQAGEYRLTFRISWENEDPATVLRDSLRVTVLPFQLPEPAQRGYTFGAFCAGADFSELQFRQMREHGIQSILFFWSHYGLKVENENGRLRLDLTDLDGMVEKFMAAGLAGPIVIALGNDSAGGLERRIAEAFGLPLIRQMREGREVRVAPLDEPRFEQRLIEAMSQLFEHAKAKRWPEIVILPYDEPTKRLMPEHRRMVRLLREHFPKIRVYGVTMDRLEWARMVDDADILSANGDFARILPFGRGNNKTVWLYGSHPAALGYGACRASYGLGRYVHQPDGSWFWSYNFHVGDPWNEFDGSTPDSAWVICWPPLHEGEASVASLGYEGLRAGVNDVRYAMALEDALAGGKGPAVEAIRGQYEAWRQGARQGHFTAGQAETARLQLTRWILRATGKPVPKGLDERLAPASQEIASRPAASAPAAGQPSGFQEVENEPD